MKKIKYLINKLSVGLSGLLAVPYGKQLERFFSKIIEETPSIYDKAIMKQITINGDQKLMKKIIT